MNSEDWGPAAAHQAETNALSALTGRGPLPEVLDALARWAEAETPDGRAVILLADQHREVLRTTAIPSLPAAFGWAIDGLAIDAAGGPCARAAATGRPVASTDLGSDPRLSEHRAAGEAGLRGAWAFPVHAGADPVGVVAIYFRHGRGLDADTGHRLQRVAALVAVAVEADRTAAQLDHLASHDPLTGLPNRQLLIDRLEMALGRSRRLASAVAVLFVDVDRLKTVNDSLGHDAGDSLLSALAQRLIGAMRPGDTVARLGGDEFALLCEDISGRHQAERIAERVAEVLGKPCVINGREVFTSASVGIAIGTGDEEPGRLLRNAGAAMQRAKERGRSRVELFDEELGGKALARLEVENDLRRGVERREFVLHYQPEVRLNGGGIVAVEALARWNHPERGLILPEKFISAAEGTGLIVPIGAQLLSEACRQVAVWDRLVGDEPFTVWLNLSGRQLSQANFIDQVGAAMEDAGVRPGRLGFEITENEVMDDAEVAVGRLLQLKRLGIRIAIDDFGTGYSSLAYLKRFPIDILKVDKAFVEGIAAGTEDASIVAAVLSLARTLGLGVVAEGVEMPEQAEILQQLGCELAQGFLYARPCPAEELTALLIQGAWDAEVGAG